MITFFVLGGLAMLFQGLKAASDKRESDEANSRNAKAQAELLLWQSGDPASPPYIGFTTGTKPDGTFAIRFNVHNPSDYPAYDISLRLWDNDKMPLAENIKTIEDMRKASIIEVRIPPINKQSVQLLDAIIEISATEIAKSFGAQFSCRVGAFSQNIAARKVNTKGWVFATQLRRLDGPNANEIVFKKVDDGFPLNAAGGVDW